jgi:hypothetical protein
MRLATLLVAAVLAAGVLWLAGEEHRRNCVSSGRTSCSVLPWDNGQRAAAVTTTPDPPEKHITRRACEFANARERAAGTPEADLMDCSLSPVR